MLRITIVSLLIAVVSSFVVVPGTSSRQDVRLQSQPSEWQGFNPLSNSGGARAMILMRQTQMQELTQAIMDNIKDDEKLQELMENSKDFLLEPLESDFAVLDPDSIYEPGMNRTERYAKYRDTMEERIGKASRGPLRKLLVTMRDYVLQFEDER
jgi:hypothetical protein